jgi:hypothetical protein
MNTGKPQERAIAGNVEAYVREAQRLFETGIRERWIDASIGPRNVRNVWRTAWAMDTILDYFTVCRVDGAPLGDAALNALDPMTGNWWDDFGWIGIAALRAVEQDMAPQHRDAFLKIAINAWAYMHGPGWSKVSTKVFPFQEDELPGWKEFADCHGNNIGAPNVWAQIGQTWSQASAEQIAKRKPRHSPGGAWNSFYTEGSHATLLPAYSGWGNYLNPVQNSVTNGLYAILTLRIYRASLYLGYRHVFDASTLDLTTCLQAWKDQIAWLGNWMVGMPSEESLLIDQEWGALVRERVSTFAAWQDVNYWDYAYRKDLVWTGDQGLFLGALREGRSFFLSPSMPAPPAVLDRYAAILKGTFNKVFARRRYGADGNVEGSFPLPWLDMGAPDRYNAASPGSDNGDYQTGVGVYMRYLLQAYIADPSVMSEAQLQTILAMADQMIKPGFGTWAQPAGDCDAFVPYSGGDLDQLTADINRLSVLLLAITISRSVAGDGQVGSGKS